MLTMLPRYVFAIDYFRFMLRCHAMLLLLPAASVIFFGAADAIFIFSRHDTPLR